MPKTIKEFQLNQSTGEVSVEYSDDSTSKFNAADMVTAQTDPVTGGIGFSGDLTGQGVTFARGAAWAKVRSLLRAEFGKSVGGGLGHIGFGGDSTAAGTGSTNDDQYSIAAQLRTLLISRGIPSAGSGLVPQYRSSATSTLWSGSGWSDFGRETNLMQGSTSRTFAPPQAGTVVTVMYGNSGASFDVSIDGGAATRVTTQAISEFKFYTVTGLPNTAHTVTITPVSGNAHIYAAEVRGTSGLRVTNFGIGGALSAQIYATAQWFFTLKAVVASGIKVYFVRSAVNDISGVPQAATISNMLAGFAYLRQNGVEPVLLTACYWQGQDAAIKTQADALVAAAVAAGYAAFDSRQVYGTYGDALALGMTADALHPGNAGYAAETLAIECSF